MPKILIAILLIMTMPALAISSAAPVKVIHSDSHQLVLEYASSNAKIERTIINGTLYQTIKPITGEHVLRLTGKPEIPFFSFLVAIPPVGDISLKIVPENSEEIGNIRLPVTPDFELIETEAGGYVREIPAKIDSQKFGNLIFPEKSGEIAQIQTMRGYRLAKINVFPYQYLASKNLIRHYRKLRIIITFPEISYQRSLRSTEARAITDILKKSVINYDQARRWQAIAPQKVMRPGKNFIARADQNKILKILIHEDGLYQLTRSELERAGFPINEISPQYLKMFLHGNEIPIIVTGEEDGKFDSTDVILFWGERNRGDDGEFYNLYSDTAVYWLMGGKTPGKRFAKKQAENGNNYPEEKIFRRSVHFEKDLLYYQGDKGYAPDTKVAPGEGWVWKFLYPEQSFNYSFTLPDIDATSDSLCRIKFRVRGITFDNNATNDHQIRIELNGETVANFQFNDQEELISTIEVPASLFKAGVNTWTLFSGQTSAEINKIYFDWMEIDYPITTEGTENWFPFQVSESGPFTVNLWNQNSNQFIVLNLTRQKELIGFKAEAKQRYIIHLFSAGFDDGNWCKIEINGEPIIDGGRRGHNIVVFDTLNGQIEDEKWFDTLEKTENSDSMAAYIGRIAEGKIVLVTIRDEGSYRMTDAAYQALESLGSSLARQVGFRDSFVLLGRKGAAPGTVPEIHVPQHQGPAELTDTLFAHQSGNYALEFQTDFNKGDFWLIAGNDSLKEPDKIIPFVRSNLREEQNQADYVIITHKKFQTVAQEFANFWQQRGLSTFIAYVDDIYDEFNFGIKHPIGIKEFLKYGYQSWKKPAPTYVMLLGDASWDPKKNMTTSVKEDFVPSWGNPVADIWYVCLDGEDDWLPEMFIGRLPIENVAQGTLYLQKMEDYENYPSARWKKQICLINGGFDDQEQYIFGYQTNEIVKDFVSPPPASLLPIVISKELDGLYEGEKRGEIVKAINDGKVWVNFIGHGGSGTWELMFHDQQVFQLENQGKLPLVTSFTCHTGRFANPQITNFGENFILYSDAGAIGFIGTTGWGFIYEDNVIARSLFRTILSDTIREFGAALTLAKVRFWQDVFISNRAEDVFLQYSLLGDPALAFTLPDKPDLLINPENITVFPETVVESDSIADIETKIENFGLATADSVQLQITDNYALTGPEDVFFGKISPVENRKMIKFPFAVGKKSGEHTIVATVDPADQVEEVDEQNNQASRTIFVASSHVSIARPAENMILPFDRIELLVNSSSDSEETYFFQLDTLNEFNNPVLQSMTEPAGAFVASWNVTSLDTGKIYFWRCKKSSAGNTSLWVSGNFYVSDHFGWGQFSPLQMSGNNFFQTKIIPDEGISLASQKTVFRVESSGFDDLNYAILFVNSTPVSTSARGHNIAVCDPFGQFIKFRNFDTHASAEDVSAMVAFLDSIPLGYFVLAGIRDSGAQMMTEQAYQALEQIGSKYCRDVGFRDAWAIIGKKGAAIGSVPEQLVQRFGGVAVAEDTLITFPELGNAETNKIGPAVQWKDLKFEIKSENSASGFAISVYGYNRNSFQWEKLKSNIEASPVNLGDINATKYPYLKLSAELSSNDRFTSPLLKNWQIAFEPASDLAISEKTVTVSSERVIQGGTVNMMAKVHNIGYVDTDSVETALWEINSQGEKELVENKILANVPCNSFEKIDFKIPLLQAGGEQKFSLEVDPENKITELVEANNQANKIITILRDTIAPKLEITFDGKTIMDGDYVAQKPVIEILFFDNSPFELTEDTTHVHVFLDGEKVSYGEGEGMARIFYGASENDSTLKARIQLIKEFPDGEHILSVFGTDINKNTVHVENNFTIISKLTLLNVYNYPNPFKTSTRFTFHLTQPAEKVTVKIFTTAGRLINQLEKYYCEAGYHQIGWDGKDRDGDEIANGVYLYKIIAVNQSERAEKIEKCVIAR